MKALGARKGAGAAVDRVALDKYDSRRKYDWDAIRQWYIEFPGTKVTHAMVSREFGPHVQQVSTHANKERWAYLRSAHQAEKMKERMRDRTQWTVDEGEKFDKSSLDTARLGMSLVTSRLIELNEVFGASRGKHAELVRKLNGGLPLDKGERYSLMDYRELESLARAALTFQEVGRKALGTDVMDLSVTLNGEVSVEEVVHIGETLTRDDPDRLAKILDVMERAGLMKAMLGEHTVIDMLPSGEEILEGSFTEEPDVPDEV